MVRPIALVLVGFLQTGLTQKFPKDRKDNFPPLPLTVCESKNDCKPKNTRVVADANWRELKGKGGELCYKGNQWNAEYCKTEHQPVTDCELQPIDYKNTLGVTTKDDELTLRFITPTGPDSYTEGSRLYLLGPESTYENFMLLNREIAFDIDLSQLPCGMNAAFYFSQMDMDGGVNRSGNPNQPGAEVGMGYCDAQSNRDNKFVNGTSNCVGWVPYSNSLGRGKYGTYCAEFDVFEGNTASNVFTSHPCKKGDYHTCKGEKQCANPTCDRGGCDFNPYRVGAIEFYGPGPRFKINTNRKFTVLTQFITSNKKDSGHLKEVRRVYMQDDKVVSLPEVTITNPDFPGGEISDNFCKAEREAFKETDDHKAQGGLKRMGESMRAGMVLAISLWADWNINMQWLDSVFPPDACTVKDKKEVCPPGAKRGPCATSEGNITDLTHNNPGASVVFSRLRFGAIGSTSGVE
ncbi:unnamed protein product [Albugo candida]|uniref:cellulose 1,4-beta-cellobiosidase (non-reducing end) n=1 Tax=Albugo candida TaxID=65357 RepID=A0A024FT20_9STRA|nr:unnamed protein product [Albugo candida]|eukprot:CCI10223.1 unnamed protein product [Albugo candida]